MVGTDISDLIVDTVNVRVETCLLAAASDLLSHETCVELAHTVRLHGTLADLLRVKHDLVCPIVACRARIAKIAADYLVARHHDLCSAIMCFDGNSTAARVL